MPGGIMKNVYQVLRDKELELQRVRGEVAALHTVIPLLAEATEWLEQGGVMTLSQSEHGKEQKTAKQEPA